MSLYSFTGSSGPDPNAQSNLNQYYQQGLAALQPGQQQVAASNPITSTGTSLLSKALAQAGQQQPQLPAQFPAGIAQQAMQQGAAQNPNVNGQNMGGVGPTQQNLALANMLMQQQQQPSDYQGVSY
jgi:hypothetical protein